jgi:hypothetical protein
MLMSLVDDHVPNRVFTLIFIGSEDKTGENIFFSLSGHHHPDEAAVGMTRVLPLNALDAVSGVFGFYFYLQKVGKVELLSLI